MYFLRITNSDRPVEFYNLDVIISVGYRINQSKEHNSGSWQTKF